MPFAIRSPDHLADAPPSLPVELYYSDEVSDGVYTAALAHHRSLWPKKPGQKADVRKWGNFADRSIRTVQDRPPITLIGTVDGEYACKAGLLPYDYGEAEYLPGGSRSSVAWPWVSGVATAPKFLRHGLARYAVRAVLDIAARIKSEKCFLYTETLPFDTVSMCEGWGWKRERLLQTADSANGPIESWLMSIVPA
jgi:hypothetical protein